MVEAAETLDQLSSEPGGKKRMVGFYELIGGERSFGGQLHRYDYAHAYSIYSHGSMALHGGTLDQFLYIWDDPATIVPKGIGPAEGNASDLSYIDSLCNSMIVLLALIEQDVLSQPDLRT